MNVAAADGLAVFAPPRSGNAKRRDQSIPAFRRKSRGGERIRTPTLLNAIQTPSQLRHTPNCSTHYQYNLAEARNPVNRVGLPSPKNLRWTGYSRPNRMQGAFGRISLPHELH